MYKQTKIALGLVLSLASVNAMALAVTTTNDADVLAGEILGSGISITNATYTGTLTQSGTYTDGSVIGMETGIILTSGDANLAPGPNVSDASGLSLGTAGDADLAGLIPGFTTNDAAVLEFDFESTGGDLFFEFVFASEEYNEWVDSAFNDVFGFFVDGVNIALAPNGDVASINNINCTGANQDNCASFNNNDPSDLGTPTPFDIEYDGFTDVLVAEALGLTAGIHHIKIAIADAGDTILDSGVFIKTGSFSDKPPVETPEPGILALLGLGLAGMTIMRRRKQV